jgi:hypothetical protein
MVRRLCDFLTRGRQSRKRRYHFRHNDKLDQLNSCRKTPGTKISEKVSGNFSSITVDNSKIFVCFQRGTISRKIFLSHQNYV